MLMEKIFEKDSYGGIETILNGVGVPKVKK